MKWSQFVIRGSSGSLVVWHRVRPAGTNHRSRCGRLFLVEPEQSSLTAPDEVRGICRSCERSVRLEKR